MLTSEEQAELERLVRAYTTLQHLSHRAADRPSTSAIARTLGVEIGTPRKWRARWHSYRDVPVAWPRPRGWRMRPNRVPLHGLLVLHMFGDVAMKFFRANVGALGNDEPSKAAVALIVSVHLASLEFFTRGNREFFPTQRLAN